MACPNDGDFRLLLLNGKLTYLWLAPHLDLAHYWVDLWGEHWFEVLEFEHNCQATADG